MVKNCYFANTGYEAPMRTFNTNTPICFIFCGKGVWGWWWKRSLNGSIQSLHLLFLLLTLVSLTQNAAPLWKYLAQKNKHTLCHGS